MGTISCKRVIYDFTRRNREADWDTEIHTANPNKDSVEDNNNKTANLNKDGVEKSNSSKTVLLGYDFILFLEHEATELSIEKLSSVIFNTVLDSEEIECKLYVGRA